MASAAGDPPCVAVPRIADSATRRPAASGLPSAVSCTAAYQVPSSSAPTASVSAHQAATSQQAHASPPPSLGLPLCCQILLWTTRPLRCRHWRTLVQFKEALLLI